MENEFEQLQRENEELKEQVELLNLRNAQLEKSDRYTFEKKLQLLDGRDIQLGRNTGTKLGTSPSEKLGLYNKTPVVQGSAIADASVSSVSGSGDDGTINSNFSEIETKVNSLIARLEDLGVIST